MSENGAHGSTRPAFPRMNKPGHSGRRSMPAAPQGSVRIIGGRWRGTRLQVPAKPGLRPTSDRVRETLFNWLMPALPGARVLDLFAGSGALGLEAASRGAASVTLVDNGQPAVRAARENARLVERSARAGRAPAITVVAQSVQAFLGASGATWDIALLDPPYELGDAELQRTLETLAPRLAPDAVVLVERSSRSAEPGWPDGVELDRRKDYGDTTLWWARRS